jgi:exopolysaccharide biosynthesis polyprenyl glycosylphosphotransferase
MRSRKGLLNATVWLGALDATCLILAVVGGIKLIEQLNSIQSLHAWMSQTFGIWLDPIIETSISAYIREHLGGLIYFCGSIILANYVVGSYGIRVTTSRFNLFVNWAFSLAVALLVLSVTSYAWFTQLLGRGVLVASVAMYAVLSLGVKALLYGVAFRRRPFIHRVALIGIGDRAREVRRVLESEHVLPSHRVTAFIKPSESVITDHVGEAAVDGVGVVSATVDAVANVVRNLDVSLVVMCLDDDDTAARYYPALRRIRFDGIEAIDGLTAYEMYDGKIPLSFVNDAWLLQASKQLSVAVVSRFKRMFDILVTVPSCVVFVPLGLVVGLLVKLTAPRSRAIHVQDRVGRFGKIFRFYKFRTMVEGAEDSVGAVWAEKDDPRITRLGRVLRRFRLDEIPQFWNILRGEMSIVGPRPERPELADQLEMEIPFFRERENVLPGLTGWAQVQYPYTDNVEDSARKLEFDLYYIKNLSLSLDLQIVLRTLRIVLFGKERSV